MELDEYINLEARVSGRMVLLDISATGEEHVIEYDGNNRMNDLEYRRKQLKELQENVVDLEDISGGISITDLTLNDFRMDLSEYMEENMMELTQAPPALYAVTTISDEMVASELEPGAIFCLRNVNGKPAAETSYSLEPYYLVYIREDNTVKHNFIHAKKILDILKKQCIRQSIPDQDAVGVFNQQTGHAKDMDQYRGMLETAIHSIVGKEEEKGVESLFSRGGTVLSKDTFQGIEDFEVISYLIITRAA